MLFSSRKIGMSVLACVVGLSVLAASAPAEATEARNIISKMSNGKVTVNTDKAKMGIKDRIQAILTTLDEEEAAKKAPQNPSFDDDLILSLENMSAIQGGPMASREQCVRYLLRNNPNPRISVTPEELVSYYYEEGKREGIRPDVAFCQALKETGFFRYGGTVVPDQNNYCGLGTTSASVRGAYFPTAQIGVRAHIQHLKAYTSTQKPQAKVVDPRYTLVRDSYGNRTLQNWEDLNGRWAVPGNGYGQSILSMHKNVLKS